MMLFRLVSIIFSVIVWDCEGWLTSAVPNSECTALIANDEKHSKLSSYHPALHDALRLKEVAVLK